MTQMTHDKHNTVVHVYIRIRNSEAPGNCTGKKEKIETE